MGFLLGPKSYLHHVNDCLIKEYEKIVTTIVTKMNLIQ